MRSITKTLLCCRLHKVKPNANVFQLNPGYLAAMFACQMEIITFLAEHHYTNRICRVYCMDTRKKVVSCRLPKFQILKSVTLSRQRQVPVSLSTLLRDNMSYNDSGASDTQQCSKCHAFKTSQAGHWKHPIMTQDCSCWDKVAAQQQEYCISSGGNVSACCLVGTLLQNSAPFLGGDHGVHVIDCAFCMRHSWSACCCLSCSRHVGTSRNWSSTVT